MGLRVLTLGSEKRVMNLLYVNLNHSKTEESYVLLLPLGNVSGDCYLTFKWQGLCLNFSSWFIKNVLFEQKKIKLWSKQNFVENKTEIMQHILKMQQISLLPKYIKWICRGVFYVHSHMQTQVI
jgi:hypothetical protein